MSFFTHKYLSSPDATLVELAAGGERMAAVIRLCIIGLLWGSAVFASLALNNNFIELNVGIAAASVALLSSYLLLYFSKTNSYITLRHFLISVIDVTLVSLTLLFFAILDRPEVAINSMVVWEVYLLFIIATCLYFDIRVCIVAGLTAIVQYGFILLWVTTKWDMTAHSVVANVYTGISWYVQSCRFILLICAALIAIGIVVRCRKLITLSGTDTLTGLENRRVLEARMQQEISRSLRESKVFSIAYLDIDHFKHFNDKWGHAAGDVALKYFSDVLKHHVRTEDIVSRWGGEEFVIMFPNTDMQMAKMLLERIQDKLKSEPVTLSHGNEVLKFSAGISRFSYDGMHHAELIDKADTRLKIAKETGRDKVVTSSE